MKRRLIIIIKLDYTIESPEERNELVKQILAENPNPSDQYLEILADYLVLCMEKQEKKQKKILTDNRMVTINKRETSFEGLAAQMETGEDGIYGLIKKDKNVIFQPKITITKQDVQDIPALKNLREFIHKWEALLTRASGRTAFFIKRTLIEMRKDQYVIKNSFKPPITFNKITHNSPHSPELPWHEWINENGEICYSGISLLNPKVVSIILCNYARLSSNTHIDFNGDTWYLMQDFNELMRRALKPYPVYQYIVAEKINNSSNVEIKGLLEKKFGFTHSLEYISNLWRKKIPKIIAQQALDDWLVWYYSEKEYGHWKKCSCCGQIKLAHSRFFSINKSSKDGWYSLCKACRNKKKKEKKG